MVPRWSLGGEGLKVHDKISHCISSMSPVLLDIHVYPMPEFSDFQRTNSEFAKSEQIYPVKITLA
jgi:hypothetical protein